jgi:CcmD family protein
VAATPQLENDLAYLAAGLITIWVGVFGYVAFLARKEAAIERKLERILQARFEGKNP